MKHLKTPEPGNLVSLVDAAVERALAARQGAKTLDADQASQISGGLMPALNLGLARPGGPAGPWIGLILQTPKLWR